ncbi:MAG: protein-export chaperone SecB [Salinivirgaceae bacterium]|nr:protein-export chaperone SecB [Salinivirgaceae bacterium]
MEKDAFKLLNILLIESSFKREPQIDFDNQDLHNNINIDVQNSTESSNILYVTVIMNFDTSIKNKKFISSKIVMLGVFEYGEELTLSLDSFANINAPAIIFPFIREHLSNVSMKAGIQPILLPPINFVELAKEKKAINLRK